MYMTTTTTVVANAVATVVTIVTIAVDSVVTTRSVHTFNIEVNL